MDTSDSWETEGIQEFNFTNLKTLQTQALICENNHILAIFILSKIKS